MDPKTLASLDPKLRETYERVMGTASSSPAQSSSSPISPAPSAGIPPAPPPSPAPSSTFTSIPFLTTSSQPPPPAAPPSPVPDTPKTLSADNSPNMDNAIPPTIFYTSPPQNSSVPPAAPSPALPDSSLSNVPIPPPAASAPAPQATNSLNTFPQSTIPPAQIPNPVSLEPSPINIPSNQANEAELQLSKPLQPLPSPSSVIQQAIGQTAVHSDSPSAFIRFLYIFVGIIFFVVYAIFWLKIFHYPLPF